MSFADDVLDRVPVRGSRIELTGLEEAKGMVKRERAIARAVLEHFEAAWPRGLIFGVGSAQEYYLKKTDQEAHEMTGTGALSHIAYALREALSRDPPLSIGEEALIPGRTVTISYEKKHLAILPVGSLQSLEPIVLVYEHGTFHVKSDHPPQPDVQTNVSEGEANVSAMQGDETAQRVLEAIAVGAPSDATPLVTYFIRTLISKGRSVSADIKKAVGILLIVVAILGALALATTAITAIVRWWKRAHVVPTSIPTPGGVHFPGPRVVTDGESVVGFELGPHDITEEVVLETGTFSPVFYPALSSGHMRFGVHIPITGPFSALTFSGVIDEQTIGDRAYVFMHRAEERNRLRILLLYDHGQTPRHAHVMLQISARSRFDNLPVFLPTYPALNVPMVPVFEGGIRCRQHGEWLYRYAIYGVEIDDPCYQGPLPCNYHYDVTWIPGEMTGQDTHTR